MSKPRTPDQKMSADIPEPERHVFWVDPAGCRWRGSQDSFRKNGISFLDLTDADRKAIADNNPALADE